MTGPSGLPSCGPLCRTGLAPLPSQGQHSSSSSPASRQHSNLSTSSGMASSRELEQLGGMAAPAARHPSADSQGSVLASAADHLGIQRRCWLLLTQACVAPPARPTIARSRHRTRSLTGSHTRRTRLLLQSENGARGCLAVDRPQCMTVFLMTNKQLQLRCAACISPLNELLCADGMAKAVSMVVGIHQQHVCCH